MRVKKDLDSGDRKGIWGKREWGGWRGMVSKNIKIWYVYVLIPQECNYYVSQAYTNIFN